MIRHRDWKQSICYGMGMLQNKKMHMVVLVWILDCNSIPEGFPICVCPGVGPNFHIFCSIARPNFKQDTPGRPSW